MGKKVVIIVGFVLVVAGVLMLAGLNGNTYPSVEELEASLPRGDEYEFRAEFNEMEKITIGCEKCDKKNECFLSCVDVCYDKNMFLVGVLPLLGSELEKEGKCPCLCRPLAHINELIILQSVNNNNVEDCERIEVEVDNLGVDNCYMTSAIFFQNESICEKIELNTTKNTCYFKVATIKKDLDLCANKIFQENRISCEEYVTGKKEAPIAIPE